jgi:hypothetical protein
MVWNVLLLSHVMTQALHNGGSKFTGSSIPNAAATRLKDM